MQRKEMHVSTNGGLDSTPASGSIVPIDLSSLYDAAASLDFEVRDEPCRVLVTGGREFADLGSVAAVLRGVSSTRGRLHVTHGAAKGLDQLVNELAGSLEPVGWEREGIPVTSEDWRVKGNRAGHMRNQVMVNRGHDVCVGWPDLHLPSNGTWGCLAKAYAARIPTFVVERRTIRPFDLKDVR